MAYPTDRKYTKEHEWIQVNGNSATVGITDYAQQSLGDIVFVETPKVGAELTAGKTFGTVESVKAVSDLFAPVSGTVTEVNADLATAPEKVNSDAHGAWMRFLREANLAPSFRRKLIHHPVAIQINCQLLDTILGVKSKNGACWYIHLVRLVRLNKAGNRFIANLRKWIRFE